MQIPHPDGPKSERGQQDLELNHTHFLLLDDGTYYNYELKDYRTQLVTAISSYNNANGTNDIHLPIILMSIF